MQVYGMPMKDVIQEKSGDGITSAIDFTLECRQGAQSCGRSREDHHAR